MHPKSISDHGINLIKKFEGLAKVNTDGMVVPYRCSANVLTIGYGHTKGVKKNMRITKEGIVSSQGSPPSCWMADDRGQDHPQGGNNPTNRQSNLKVRLGLDHPTDLPENKERITVV